MKGNFLRPRIRFLSVAGGRGRGRELFGQVFFESHVVLCSSAITTIKASTEKKIVFMGGTRTFSPSVTRLTTLELSRNNNSGSSQINRTGGGGGGGGGPSLSVRISTKSKASSERSSHSELSLATDGPSCIFVGPIETASRETLEALYRQARDAYYNGKPLIVDDMFDKIELKLRWYGSKSVVKYPRCSLRRHSTYADAEEDPSQVLALAGVWVLLLSFMSLALFLPTIHTVGLAYRDVLNSRLFSSGIESSFKSHEVVNNIILIAIGSVVGYPVASAAVGALQRLWRNDLVALKGPCPNCGEEVFAFVRADLSNRASHRADCHVCESSLEFRTRVEEKDAIPSLHLKIEGTKQAISRSSKRWVYGRIYLLKQRRKGLRQRRM